MWHSTILVTETGGGLRVGDVVLGCDLKPARIVWIEGNAIGLKRLGWWGRFWWRFRGMFLD